MKIIAIIPARGGSKGVPKKNIRKVKGKPLIAYSIEAAKKSRFLGDFYVSTDDKEIAVVAEKYGAKIIPRPKEYAQDDTPDLPVFTHALAWLEKKGIKADALINLRPTAPLRTGEDIDNAIAILKKTNADSVRSFCEVSEHPYWMFRVEGDKAVAFDEKRPISKYPRRQLLPKLYILNGAVDIMTAKNLKKGDLYGKDMRAYVMPREKSVDLDTEEDFKELERLL